MHLLVVVAAVTACIALVFGATALFVTRLRTGWSEAMAAGGVVAALLALAVQALVVFTVPNALTKMDQLTMSTVGYLRIFDLASLCVLGWALTVSMVVLHVGKRWVWKAVALAYVAIAFYLLNIIWFHPPHDIGATHWRVMLGDAAITRDHPDWARGLALAYGLPSLAASYTLLLPPGRNLLRVFRLRAIASGIFIIATFGFLGVAFGAADRLDWHLWGLFVSMAGAGAILLGYRPPQWLKDRLDPPQAILTKWPASKQPVDNQPEPHGGVRHGDPPSPP